MNNLKSSFLSSFGVLVYISLVSLVMSNAEEVFGKEDDFFTPIGFLLLFTLSALVVGGIVLGRPLMLYLDGKKKEALALFGATVGWLGIFTIAMLVVLALR